MAIATRTERKPVSFRMPTKALSIVDTACRIVHKDRTEFVLDAAVEKAEQVLQDRTIFRLSEADYNAFVDALDNPPEPNECLKALARKKPLWER